MEVEKKYRATLQTESDEKKTIMRMRMPPAAKKKRYKIKTVELGRKLVLSCLLVFNFNY